MKRFDLIKRASAAALPGALFVLLAVAPATAQNNNNSNDRTNTTTSTRTEDRDKGFDWGLLGLLGLAGLAGLMPKKRDVVVRDHDVNANRR